VLPNFANVKYYFFAYCIYWAVKLNKEKWIFDNFTWVIFLKVGTFIYFKRFKVKGQIVE